MLTAPSANYYTVATGVNDSGQVVGYCSPDGITDHGSLYDTDQFTVLNGPGAYQTAALGINNAGQIVGSFDRNCTGCG